MSPIFILNDIQCTYIPTQQSYYMYDRKQIGKKKLKQEA